MGKKGDLSDFERGMVVGARRAGLSISKTADLLGFSRTTISRVYREWSEKEKISSERQLCGRKCLVDVRGQRRMGRLVRDDRKATVTQITTRYNQGMQNTISERTTRRTLKQMGYSSRRPHRVPLLSAKNRKQRLQFAQAHQNWTIEDWKNVAWSDESRFLLRHSDGRVRIWRKEHESMDPSCLVSMVQAGGGGGGVMVWGIFSWHTLGPLVPIEHHLNATAYLSIVADHVHPFMTTVYPSSDGYFQQDNAPCHKAQIISDWFLEHDNEFTLLRWPPQSPDLNPIEHLWDMVEREILIMDVQPTNLQQLRDAIMSIWTKISEECFQHLVESMPRRIKAVLKAKGGPTRY
uniref:Transposase Tc1-like domain-containing protein n=1 Tax=Sinocyclocheilus rhinocerous TaxID=307959 RepID=A0A673HQB6_9TELE